MAAMALPAPSTLAPCKLSRTTCPATSFRACARSPTSRRVVQNVGTALRSHVLRSEVQLDKIAEQLSSIRRKCGRNHLVKPNTVTANYLRIGSMGLGKCIEKVVEGSDWKKSFQVGTEQQRKLPYGKGIGIACSSYICGAGLPIYWNNMPQSGVQLRLDRQGGVLSDVWLDRYRPGFRFDSRLHCRRSTRNRSVRHSRRYR